MEDIMVMSAPESFMGKEIAAKRAEFDSWVETQIKQLRIDRDQHERSMENLNGEALKLVELEKKYKMQSEQLYQKLAQEKAELDQAQERLVELKSEEETLPPLLARLQDELQQEQKVLDRKRKVFEREEKARHYKMQEMTKGLQFYKERLGLDFQKTGGNTLKFIFTNVDPKDHERKFVFVISIDGNDQYNLKECSPSFQGMERCVEIVNETSDFSRFVLSMRAGFRRYVLQGQNGSGSGSA